MAKRGRNLAALAALGALGYGYMARGDKQDGTKVPVSDAVPVGTRARNEDERDGTASVDPLEAANARTPIEVPAGPRATAPAVTPSSTRSMAPARSKIPEREDTTKSLERETARAGRGQIIEKDKSTASTLPGAMGAYASRAGTRAPTTLDQALSEAKPGSTFTFQGKTYEKEPAQQKMSSTNKAATSASSGLTLGTPTRPAPKVPSIYAGPEAWAAYRKQQAAGMKKGGVVKKMASGGSTGGASRRGDGIAQRGKTKGRMV